MNYALFFQIEFDLFDDLLILMLLGHFVKIFLEKQNSIQLYLNKIIKQTLKNTYLNNNRS